MMGLNKDSRGSVSKSSLKGFLGVLNDGVKKYSRRPESKPSLKAKRVLRRPHASP